MLKVFSLFKVQFKFDTDEVTDICIQCNHCNKNVTCQFSETVTINILLVFIKSVVFHHVGLSWMVENKELYKLSVEDHSIKKCTGGPWFNLKNVENYMAPYLSNSLSLYVKTDMTYYVSYMPLTKIIIGQMMQQTLAVE